MQPNTDGSLKKIRSRSAHDLRLRYSFTFHHDNDLRHTAKTTLEWLRNKALYVQVPQPKTRLEPHRTFVERAVEGSSQMLPIQSNCVSEDLPRRM